MRDIRLKADSGAISRASDFVESACRDLGMDQDETYALLLILDELVANVCHYAYPDGEGSLEVAIGMEGNRCVLKLTDSGVPFDPTRHQDPKTEGPVEDRKVGGLGIYFIKRKAERFEYRRVGERNVVTVVTRVGGGTREGPPDGGESA